MVDWEAVALLTRVRFPLRAYGKEKSCGYGFAIDIYIWYLPIVLVLEDERRNEQRIQNKNSNCMVTVDSNSKLILGLQVLRSIFKQSKGR